MRSESGFVPSGRVPLAVVLGTNDVASAVAHALFLAGYGVVMSRDPGQPVLRRTMAFDDALIGGPLELEGVLARPAFGLVDLLHACMERSAVSVTVMELGELLCLGLIDVLVDARMRMRALKVDVRPFARATIGLGPGFIPGRHVDVAVETAPERIGVVTDGATLAAHGRSTPLAGAGRERFARAPGAGLWLTDAAIGEGVMQGAPLGTCGGQVVAAPLSGRLRGLVRSGVDVPEGLKVAEVDPAPEGAPSWTGLAPRARSIAAATLDAVRLVQAMEAGQMPAAPAH